MSLYQYIQDIKLMKIGASPRSAVRAGLKSLDEALSPRAMGAVYEWAEDNIFLSGRQGATPGRYKTDLTPYVREPLEIFRDRGTTDGTFCWGTQTSKTLMIMIGVGYRLVNDPVFILWVMPNIGNCKTFSRNRWQVLVDDCPAVKAQKPQGPNARHLYTVTEQFFEKATVKFAGSNSPANLASIPAGLLLLDETDKFPMSDDAESGALENAEERTKSFPFPLRVKASTPTTVKGQIWCQFLAGDQRHYYVPCPHCKKEILLKFTFGKGQPGGVRWSEEAEKVEDMTAVAESAYYECQLCKGKVVDRYKPTMLLAGRWVPHNPKAMKGVRSYHLNSLYAPWKDTTFGAIAVKWLQSRGNKEKRQIFITSLLAEPWDVSKLEDAPEIFMEDYDPAAVSLVGRVPVFSIDVQENHYWGEVRAWDGKTRHSYMLWCGRLETEEELLEKQKEFKVEGKCTVIDMARYPNRVAQMIVRNNWRGMWGADRLYFTVTLNGGLKVNRIFSAVEYRDPYLGTVRASDDNPRAKYVKICQPALNPLLEDLRSAKPPIYHVLATAHPKYADHMNAEILTERQLKNGKWVEYWKQVSKLNHLRDCAKMNLCCAIICGLIPDTVTPNPERKRKPEPYVAPADDSDVDVNYVLQTVS
jgi:DNA-directed RNA polymerase subunit RPC12/RpoP